MKLNCDCWKPVAVSLSEPDYSMIRTAFNFSNVTSVAYYYVNSNRSAVYSSVGVGPVYLQGVSTSMNEELVSGSHQVNLPYGSVIALSKGTSENQPTLGFNRSGHNEFSILIHNSTGPFPLIFDQSFDVGWKLCVGGSVILPAGNECIPEGEHFVANGYANGWIVNKTGSFRLVIYYVPDVVEFYSIISSLTVVVVVAALVLRPYLKPQFGLVLLGRFRPRSRHANDSSE